MGVDLSVPLLCNALAFILCFVGALEFQSGGLLGWPQSPRTPVVVPDTRTT